MKKVIITTGAVIMSLGAMSAADYIRVINVQNTSTSSRVSVVRGNEFRVLFTGDYLFASPLTTQEAVNKMAMHSDEYITAVATNTTPVKGKVQEFAIARMEAWAKGGVAAYMIELAKQLDLMK
jgi:hypothetical protein